MRRAITTITLAVLAVALSACGGGDVSGSVREPSSAMPGSALPTLVPPSPEATGADAGPDSTVAPASRSTSSPPDTSPTNSSPSTKVPTEVTLAKYQDLYTKYADPASEELGKTLDVLGRSSSSPADQSAACAGTVGAVDAFSMATTTGAWAGDDQVQALPDVQDALVGMSALLHSCANGSGIDPVEFYGALGHVSEAVGTLRIELFAA